MQIGAMVYEALVDKREGLFPIVADLIEDTKQGHPELQTYLTRLRSPKVMFRTVVDVVLKFGTKAERKLFSRIDRIVMELRHHPEKEARLVHVSDIFSKEGRRYVKSIVRTEPGIRHRKKSLLVRERKRQATDLDVWFIEAFKLLLSRYYN